MVSALDRDGRSEEYWSIWRRVAEIVHIPAPEPNISEIPYRGGVLPLRRIVCTEAQCRRCDKGLGGFKFPWLGPWSKMAAVVEPAEDMAKGPFCARGRGSPKPNTLNQLWHPTGDRGVQSSPETQPLRPKPSCFSLGFIYLNPKPESLNPLEKAVIVSA